MSWACVIIALILEGSNPASFISIGAFLLVVGGSTGATMIGFHMKDLLTIPKAAINTIKPVKVDYNVIIAQMKELAVQARRGGVLSLEEHIATQKDDYVKAGLQLVVDGADSEIIEKILETKASIAEHKLMVTAKFFDGMGGYCPTLGIIGTVLGLVKVLGNLTEPEKLGEGIAAAFVATLYGIGFANLIFLPLANKVKANVEAETLYFEMVQEAILSIHAGDNPIMLEEKLKAFLAGHEEKKAGGGGAPAEEASSEEA